VPFTGPLLPAVLMASCGGCWPRCAAPSAALTAGLAEAVTGLATRRGRTEVSAPRRLPAVPRWAETGGTASARREWAAIVRP